jgi:VWFA-related protein
VLRFLSGQRDGKKKMKDDVALSRIFAVRALVIVIFVASLNPRAYLSSQELSHDVRVVNIAVPVRVFEGNRFVDNLTMRDFEVLEDGKPQKVEAVYVVNKTAVEPQILGTGPHPWSSRSFFLFFNLFEPDPQIQKALLYFIENVLAPADHLLVITPRAFYDWTKEAKAGRGAKELSAGLAKKIRKDILAGDAAYRAVIADLKRMAGLGGIDQQMSGVVEISDHSTLESLGTADIEQFLMKYRADVDQLTALRTIDEGKILDFARAMKKTPGQKFVFYFYQKEFIPLLDPRTLQRYSEDPFLYSLITELTEVLNQRSSLDIGRLRNTFADAFINFNFLYLTKDPAGVPSIQIAEKRDISSVFKNVAAATGGLDASSASAGYLMQQAATASEHSYLLYYSPSNTVRDGKFRKIEVRVKNGDYRVSFMAGYFAN